LFAKDPVKISLKLPLAFAAALLLVAAAACYGIYSLNQSLTTYAVQVQGKHEQQVLSAGIALDFKVQVQEWKNTLLRGKNPQDLDKYWTSFRKHEQAVAVAAARLAAALPAGETRTLTQEFVTAHSVMGKRYAQAFEAFKAARFDPQVGDRAVAGIDRESVRLLDEVGRKISAESTAIAAQAAASGRQATAVSLVLMALVFCACAVGGVLFSRTITGPLGRAVAVAQAVAGGDLSVSLDARGQDEMAQLLKALQAMRDSLVRVVSNVRENADSVATASAQIAQGNLDLSSRTEEQASALQQTAASMDQLSTTVRTNADNARQASELAQGAAQVAVRGGGVVGDVVSTMKGIDDSSRRVSEIIGVIDGIAFQTNILALNAAVEAARAGEQGRGFAVVAGEVRSLAQRSADAAREIKTLIADSVQRVGQGSALVGEAGTIMEEVVASIQKVTGIIGEISHASSEQSAGVGQVTQAVGQMDAATQQNAALVEEGAAAAQSLKAQAAQLVQAVAVFRMAPA
jgi:methyl-accepting chemotaxis protein